MNKIEGDESLEGIGFMKRNKRIGVILKTLLDYPNRVFTLNHFSQQLNAAKSSISEDIVILKSILTELDLGRIETITGASGGVVIKPYKSPEAIKSLLAEISEDLMEPGRMIPGGFLYYTDILYDPHRMKDLGESIAQHFSHHAIDYVMTVETKGIPLAIMTAKYLNVPLVVARKDNRVSEGATISINFVSGSTGKLQTMYCSKRAIQPRSNVLIVDDFLRAGGTVRGMSDLVREFDSNVVGVAVFMENTGIEKKMVTDYFALLKMAFTEEGVQVTSNLG